jgi:hypothetical protein
MVDMTELDGMILELESDSADAYDGNAVTIGEGDSEVKVPNVVIGGEIGVGVPKIMRGAGVDEAVFSSA